MEFSPCPLSAYHMLDTGLGTCHASLGPPYKLSTTLKP